MKSGGGDVQKQFGMALTQPKLPQLGDRLVSRPQVDGGASAIEESGEVGVRPDAEPLFEGLLGKNHGARSIDLFTGDRQAVFATRPLSSRPMDTLAQIIERAMAERGMDAPAVAKASGLTKQSVYNVLNGTTKWDKIRAITLFALARALGTRDAFSLYAGGAGHRAALSQSVGIDGDTLVEAEKLVAIEETIVGATYEPEPRMRRIAALYERVMADGGQLSRQHMDDFIRAATQAGGVQDGHNEAAATGRKAGVKR